MNRREGDMSTALAWQASVNYVQLAELEIDPTQLDACKATMKEQIETAIRVEPGVLVLYAMAHNDDPVRITVFEVYKDMDAYRAHLESPHFRKYKATTEKMVKSLKLVPVTPILIATK
jgi:quinol monooxygenase YgiN